MRVSRLFLCRRWVCVLFFGLTLGLGALAAPQDPTEANIARVTAALLQQDHYSHQPFDQEISGRFLDRYLDVLDGLHSYFLQSDIQEFEPYRTNLHVLTLRKGDTSPAHLIFKRFLERVEQRVTFATNVVQTETFDFSGHDSYIANRRKLPYPKDMAAAKELWRQEVRFEFLQEKLSALNIRYSGPVTYDKGGNARIALVKDKQHPLGFDLLPQTFYGDDGKPFGQLKVSENKTNATVEISSLNGENLRKVTRKIFGVNRAELGTLSFRRQTNDLATAATNAVVSPEKNFTLTNRYVGFIELNQKNIPEIQKTLTNRYSRVLRMYKELEPDDVLEYYLDALARAYDPHSDYMGHRQMENFAISLKLSLFGIGAVLRSEDGYCKIAELVPGPAMKSGKIKPEDRIVAVAQKGKDAVEVVGMPLSKVVELIRGPKGTEVTLTVIPADAPDSSVRKTVTLIRDEIKLEDQQAKAKIFEAPDKKGNKTRIGVIDLPSFYGDMDKGRAADRKSTTTDVARLIKRLKQEKVSGIVLDLRRNGGGYLEEAVSLTGLFIKKGPVVQTKDMDGTIVTDSDTDPSVLYDGPLVVLISKASASASEILAGALQDYGRALIVGDRSSFGKGTVQTLLRLAPLFEDKRLTSSYDPGNLKLTIKKFYRAGGASTQLKGVVPDIELPSLLSHSEIGESSMEYPLQWDEVPSADPEKLNLVKPYLPELQKRSAARIKTEKDFVYVHEDIALFKKALAEKSVSLNEAERMKEKDQEKARMEARKKERLARAKADEKVYEITLGNVDLAELQPPAVKTNHLAAAESEFMGLEDEGDLAENKAAHLDVAQVTLDEARRILIDYIGLLEEKNGSLMAH